MPTLDRTLGCVDRESAIKTARRENNYFGRNAVDVLTYDELHIFRGQWTPGANAADAEAVRDGPLTPDPIVLEDTP